MIAASSLLSQPALFRRWNKDDANQIDYLSVRSQLAMIVPTIDIDRRSE